MFKANAWQRLSANRLHLVATFGFLQSEFPVDSTSSLIVDERVDARVLRLQQIEKWNWIS